MPEVIELLHLCTNSSQQGVILTSFLTRVGLEIWLCCSFWMSHPCCVTCTSSFRSTQYKLNRCSNILCSQKPCCIRPEPCLNQLPLMCFKPLLCLRNYTLDYPLVSLFHAWLCFTIPCLTVLSTELPFRFISKASLNECYTLLLRLADFYRSHYLQRRPPSYTITLHNLVRKACEPKSTLFSTPDLLITNLASLFYKCNLQFM